ncbi:MAG: AraC family transcriptional regulator [Pyrinomonadaceae bacterium]|nr:AraC family transcriptional regulator [Pyrinomonadaceae bacterium]
MDQSDSPFSTLADRERVLPTGTTHLAIRLSSHPLRLFDDVHDCTKREIGYAIVGGVRSTYYVRDISEPASSVGAQLLPGSAELLFGVTADELAGRHTPLEDLWGHSAFETRERLLEGGSLERQLDMFESFLVARLPRVRGLHPAVAHALEQFSTTSDVREVVRQTGYSHRRFIELFGRAVGLTPKLYCRVLRFQHVVGLTAAKQSGSWIDVALAAGYSDQSHFNRQFREFAGVTPGEYHALSPSSPNHVPILRSPR